MENWTVRYTVVSEIVGGALDRSLVRQVLDEVGTIQDAETVASGLRSGEEDPPGFQIIQNGNVWVVTLSLEGSMNGGSLRGTEFHVSTRN